MAAVTGNRATWTNIRSKIAAMGGVSSAVIGEPIKAMQSGVVAIIADNGRIDETTLGHAREIHVVTLRRYENAFQESRDAIDTRLDEWRAQIMSDIFGDFDLGGNIAYPLPTQCSWQYGWQTVENTMYRLLDFTLAYRVDERTAFVA